MLSEYQKSILRLFEHDLDYITHNQGENLKGYFYSPIKKFRKNIRMRTVEILYNEGYINYINDRSFVMKRTDKKI